MTNVRVLRSSTGGCWARVSQWRLEPPFVGCIVLRIHVCRGFFVFVNVGLKTHREGWKEGGRRKTHAEKSQYTPSFKGGWVGIFFPLSHCFTCLLLL